MENKDYDLILYLNFTLGQVVELLESGGEPGKELALSFLISAKSLVIKLHPELNYEEEN